jgi:ribose transport system permease protein/putative xylitol transport system permease protein
MHASVSTVRRQLASPSARAAVQVWLPRSVPFLALGLMIVAFASTPNFIGVTNLEAILRQLPVLLLVAAGATLPIMLGSIDLSLGGIMVLAGGSAAVLVPKHGEQALLVAPLIGLAAGFVNGLVVAGARLPSFLVTLGTLFVFDGLAQIVMGGIPHPYTGEVSRSLGTQSTSVLGLSVPYTAFLALTILAVLTLFAVRTRWGRYLYAVGGGENVARLSGVHVGRVKVMAFTLAGLLAGVAGLVLTMRASSATPDMGDPFLLTSIAAVVVGGTSLSGGIGGPQWTLLGALVILVLDDGMTLAGINPDYQTIIRGLVIIAASALTLRRTGSAVK